MRKWLSVIGLAGVMAVWVDSASAQAPPEFRAMACSRFQWPQETNKVPDLNLTKAYIDNLMQKLKAHNFNAVIFQMRGQCDTLYPSPYEPWSNILSSDGNAPAGWGDFDPMAYAINAAHANGLEFHAYLNGCVAWNKATPPEYCSRHIYWEHCDITDPDKRDWLLCKSDGTPVGFTSEYVWVAPGVPSFQAYWRKQIMYVVEYYNGSDPVKRPAVDGVHFDRCRLPDSVYSYDPISNSRRLGEGNPDGLSIGDWTADQITRMLTDVYAQINEYTENISPTRHRVKVSSAPLGLYLRERYPGYPAGYQYGRSKCYQDAQAWLAAGAQDFICPQIYWADPPYRTGTPYFSDVLPDWLYNNSGRHVYAYCNVSATGPGLLAENSVMKTMVDQIGQDNAYGTVIWSVDPFNDNNYWPLFSGPGGPYEYPAPTPAMPWKDNPTDAIIIGTVTDGTNPIADVQIARTGTTYKALSSADGLYSFLKVPPGTYTLTYTKAGKPSTTRQVTVVAGQVLRVPEVVLTDVLPPQITNVQATNIGDTSATITWTTNVGSTSQVEYGTTIGYGQSTTLDANLVTSHSVNLTGLAPGTLYHYRVISSISGASSTSADFTFTTTGSPALPVISNVAVGNWGATSSTNLSAVITWTTDLPADSQVEYGLTTSYGSTTALDSALVNSHSVTLTGLAQSTLYHYRVRSAAATGTSYSGDYTFRTGIVIDNTDSRCTTTGNWTSGSYTGIPRFGDNYLYASSTGSQSSTTAVCRWTPNIELSGNYDVYVFYQTGHNRNSAAPFTISYFGGQLQSIQNQLSVPSSGGWFKIGSNLPFAVGTNGYVQVANNSTDGEGLISADAALFAWAADQPPTAPTGVTASAVSADSIQLTWTASTDDIGVAGYKIYRNGDLVGTSPTTSYLDTGLAANTSYSYRVSAFDALPNESAQSSPAVSRTTLSQPPASDSVTPDRSVACVGYHLTWAATEGFGAGKVQYYRYAWDRNPTYSFTGSEPQWTSGTLQTTLDAEGTWYLHVKGYNSEHVANGTFDYAVTACLPTPADFDSNCTVDQADWAIFEACAAGPGLPYRSGCGLTPDGQGIIPADFDADGDVDQEDFGVFQRCYTGGGPADPACANQ